MAVKGLIYFEFMPEIWQAYTMEECIHILGFREIFFFPELNNDGMVVVDFITAVVFNVEKCQRQCTNKNTFNEMVILSFLFLSTAVCRTA